MRDEWPLLSLAKEVPGCACKKVKQQLKSNVFTFQRLSGKEKYIQKT